MQKTDTLECDDTEIYAILKQAPGVKAQCKVFSHYQAKPRHGSPFRVPEELNDIVSNRAIWPD